MTARLPGLLLALSLALIAQWLHQLPIPPFTLAGRHPVDPYLLAVLLGICARNLLPLGRWPLAGARFAVKKLLPLAILLLGARFDFQRVLALSVRGLGLSLLSLLAALALTLWLARRFGVPQRLGLLLGIGTAICGGTAIAVAAPVIEADEQETSYALAVITVAGLAAIFIFPLIGHALAMGQRDFGLWAGVAIHATPQVMAAGFSYGPLAGEVAVVVKLVRVLLLAPCLVCLSLWRARERRREQEFYLSEPLRWQTLFPPFIVGFLLLAVANSLHLLPTLTLDFAPEALGGGGRYQIALGVLAVQGSKLLTVTAMAGIGLAVQLSQLLSIGPRGLYVGALSALLLSLLSLGLISLGLF